MAATKRVAGVVTMQLAAGQANMGKAGQALGPYGVNIVEVVRSYNAATEHQRGRTVPAVVTIYEDRSFSLPSRPHPPPRCCARRPGWRRAQPIPMACRWPR